MERSVQHQSQHGNGTVPQGFESQQCVVEGAEATAGHQHQGQAPTADLLNLQPVPAQGGHHPAGRFQHQGLVPSGQAQPLGINQQLFLFRRPMGGNRGLQPVALLQDSPWRQAEHLLHPLAVTAIGEPALNWFPVAGCQSLDQQRTDHGLAHIGIGASDDQTHGSLWANKSNISQFRQAGEGQWLRKRRHWPGDRGS